MLGQLFLVACVIAALAAIGIVFVVFGPVPVKRKVVVVPRLSAAGPVTTNPVPSLVAQLAAPAGEAHFHTIHGTAPPTAAAPTRAPHREPPPLPIPVTPTLAKPKGQKVQPLPKKRSAKGTDSPFAPVVRRREISADEAATNQHRHVLDDPTNQVRRAYFESEELTTVDDN